MKSQWRCFLLFMVFFATPACTQSQVHSSKQVYADVGTWPVTAPAAIAFGDRFQPFRAVWSREYRNMGGEMRTDRVVMVAEELSWYGRPVISVTLHDAGSVESPDTNARTTSVYLDRETLGLKRATAPTSGTAEDYDVVAVHPMGITTTSVTTATGAAETREFATDETVFAGFGTEFLVWAASGLQTDSRGVFLLYSTGANGLIPSIIRVIDREDVELPNGEPASAWVVERPINQPDNARMHHFRILDRAPYLVSRHVIDVESGETSFRFRLLEWQPLGDY